MLKMLVRDLHQISLSMRSFVIRRRFSIETYDKKEWTLNVHVIDSAKSVTLENFLLIKPPQAKRAEFIKNGEMLFIPGLPKALVSSLIMKIRKRQPSITLWRCALDKVKILDKVANQKAHFCFHFQAWQGRDPGFLLSKNFGGDFCLTNFLSNDQIENQNSQGPREVDQDQNQAKILT